MLTCAISWFAMTKRTTPANHLVTTTSLLLLLLVIVLRRPWPHCRMLRSSTRSPPPPPPLHTPRLPRPPRLHSRTRRRWSLHVDDDPRTALLASTRLSKYSKRDFDPVPSSSSTLHVLGYSLRNNRRIGRRRASRAVQKSCSTWLCHLTQ